ncbi:SRPBCC domain-containing protein [Streptomyces turgidiscabies]|nr:SRPBCC domain-containing protein [Streptomyces turgidiscabies]
MPTNVALTSPTQVRPVWAVIANHYAKRRGLSATYLTQIAAKAAPEGGGGGFGPNSGGFDQLGFGTLAFTRDKATATKSTPGPAASAPTSGAVSDARPRTAATASASAFASASTAVSPTPGGATPHTSPGTPQTVSPPGRVSDLPAPSPALAQPTGCTRIGDVQLFGCTECRHFKDTSRSFLMSEDRKNREDSIERDTLIDAPVARVWSLVSAPGFWVADPESIKGTTAVEGESMVARNPEHGDFPVLVVKVEPQSYLAYRWAPATPGDELTESNSTLVEFTLSPEGDKTRLTVVESGFAALAVSEEVRAQTIQNLSHGWPQVLDSTKKRVEESTV